MFAHTSPVFVDIAWRRVARPDAASWCVDLLDTLQAFVVEHGRFDPGRRDEQLGDLVAVPDRARAVYRDILDGATATS